MESRHIRGLVMVVLAVALVAFAFFLRWHRGNGLLSADVGDHPGRLLFLAYALVGLVVNVYIVGRGRLFYIGAADSEARGRPFDELRWVMLFGGIHPLARALTILLWPLWLIILAVMRWDVDEET
jgi:hypothetical protein